MYRKNKIKKKILILNKKKEFYDRFLQIREYQTNETNDKINIVRQLIIKQLEEILKIEFPEAKQIYKSLDDFINFVDKTTIFLNSSTQKIFLDEGLVIDIDKMNEFIEKSSEILERIFKKHAFFFKEVILQII